MIEALTASSNASSAYRNRMESSSRMWPTRCSRYRMAASTNRSTAAESPWRYSPMASSSNELSNERIHRSDLRDVSAGDLKPDRRPHACGQHINPPLDRHGPGVRQPRDLERGV